MPDTQDIFATDPADAYLDGAADLVDDAHRWPRQMAEWTDLLADELEQGRSGLAPPAARALAARLIARLAREFGGGSVYVPKGDALERGLRDLRIWAEFDGTVAGPGGIETLARRERLAIQTVYRIMKAQRDRHRRRVQPDLFGEGEGGRDAHSPKTRPALPEAPA